MSIQLTAGGSLKAPMSYEGYLALGETKHHEYYDGLTVVNPPSKRHVLVARRLTRLLEDACGDGYDVLPEFGWQPAPHTVFEPDIMVARKGLPGPQLLLEPPAIVIEVTSPSTRGEDLGRKMQAYAQGGAEWYWIVDLEADNITIYHNRSFTFVITQTVDTGRPLNVSEPVTVRINPVAVFA